MQIWSNTKTLDGFVPNLTFTSDKAAAVVALVGGKKIELNDFPRLRGNFKTGVGRDNVPEAEAAQRGIACGFPSPQTAEIIYEETANFACHLILQCAFAGAGDFAAWSKKDRRALASHRLLIVGGGDIGRPVAAKMAPFMQVDTFDVAINKSEELEAKVRAADCISLHVPLNASTRDLINREVLGWMRDGAALVNTARGAVVSEEALFEELQSGRLRAAFDVFWNEPYAGKLLGLPGDRFIRSPHVASTCREFLAATAADLLRFISGLDSANAGKA